MKKILYAMCLVTLGCSFVNAEHVKNNKTPDVMSQLLTKYSNEQTFTKLWNSLNDTERKELIIKDHILDELLQSNSFNKNALGKILEFCHIHKLEILTLQEQKDQTTEMKFYILPIYYEQIIKDNDLCLLFWNVIKQTKENNVIILINRHDKSNFCTLLSALATMQTPHKNGRKIVLDCIKSNDKMIDCKYDYLILSVAKALCHATGERHVWLKECFTLLKNMRNFNDIQNQESFKKVINNSNDHAFKIFCDEYFDTGRSKFVPEETESVLDTSSNDETWKRSTTSENKTNNDRNFVILPSEPVSNIDSAKIADTNRSSSGYKRSETPNNSYK